MNAEKSGCLASAFGRPDMASIVKLIQEAMYLGGLSAKLLHIIVNCDCQ